MIIIFIFFFCSFFGTYLVRKFALKKSILDVPNDRSSHSIPTPRGGGLAIALSWFIFLTFWFLTGRIEKTLFWALMSGIIIAIVGFADDIKSVSPRMRLISQIVVSAIGLCLINGLTYIDLGFIKLTMPVWANMLVLIGMIWMINLFNFIDGIDGYLGMEGVFLFGSLYLFTGDFISLILAVIIAGFLFWNWPKARIFCGDVGSTLIGYTLVILGIHFQNSNEISFLIPLILSGLFWVDATVTLLRRWFNKEKLSEAHKKHAYQRLTQAGFSHKRVLIIGIIINFCIFLLAYFSKINSSYILPALLLQIVLVLLFIKYADLKYAFKQ